MDALKPFTDDDRKTSQDTITGVMTEFSKGYVKSFGVYTVQKVNDGEPDAPVRALYEPEDINTQVHKEGWLSKEGAIIRNWKRRYFRVLPDWSLSYSENEKAKKIKGKLTLGGYTVLDHEKKENTIVLKPADSDRRTWQLTADNAQECKDWKAVLRQCVTHAPNPLHKDEVRRKAFQKTYLDLHSKYGWWRPSSFSATGSEVEMLAFFTNRELNWQVIEDVLGRLKGPDMIKNKMASGIKKTAKTMVLGACTSTFKVAQEVLDKAQPILEKKIGEMLAPLKALNDKIASTIKDKMMPKLDPVIEKTLTPALEKLLPNLVKPLSDSAAIVLKCFCTIIDEKGADVYSKSGNDLSYILYRNMCEFRAPLYEMMSSSGILWETCKKLQADNAPARGERDDAGDAVSDGASLYYFDDYATEQYQDLLRNALYTCEKKDNKDAKVTAAKLCQDLLVVMTELIQEFCVLLFTPIVVVQLGDHIKVVTDPVDELIPEPMQDIISAGGKVDDSLNLILSESLQGAVKKSAPSGYDTVIKAFATVKYGSTVAVPDVLGGAGKTLRREGEEGSEKKKDEKKEEVVVVVKEEISAASPTAAGGDDHSKRVAIMVRRAGDEETVTIEIERGRGMTVANFKAAAAAKLKLQGGVTELSFQSPAHPEFNNNDAKLAEVLDGFDEEDNVLEVTSSNAADTQPKSPTAAAEASS